MKQNERDQWISVGMRIQFDGRQIFEHDFGSHYHGVGKITSINDGLVTIEVTELQYSKISGFIENGEVVSPSKYGVICPPKYDQSPSILEVSIDEIKISTSVEALRKEDWPLFTKSEKSRSFDEWTITTQQMSTMSDKEIIDLKKKEAYYIMLYVNIIVDYNEWR